MDDKSNFDFLKEHDPVFFQLAFAAEQLFSSDPNTPLIKLRQLGEALAQDMAGRCGIEFDEKTSQADLLFKLRRVRELNTQIEQFKAKLLDTYPDRSTPYFRWLGRRYRTADLSKRRTSRKGQKQGYRRMANTRETNRR